MRSSHVAVLGSHLSCFIKRFLQFLQFGPKIAEHNYMYLWRVFLRSSGITAYFDDTHGFDGYCYYRAGAFAEGH